MSVKSFVLRLFALSLIFVFLSFTHDLLTNISMQERIYTKSEIDKAITLLSGEIDSLKAANAALYQCILNLYEEIGKLKSEEVSK